MKLCKYPTLLLEELAAKEKSAIKIGPFGSQLKKTELVDKGIHVLGIENVINNIFEGLGERYISEDKFEELHSFEVKPGDILITMMGTIGELAIVPEGTSTSIMDSHLLRFRPNTKLCDRKYISWAIKCSSGVKQSLDKNARGAIMQGLNSSIIKSLPIPVPPLDEQKRIAAILDKADAIHRKRQQAVKLADDFLRATFLDMFGDPVINPKKWKLKSFGDIAIKFSDGPFGSNLKSSHYVTSGIRVIRLQNIGAGKFIDDDKAFISEDHFNSLNNHKCEPGDVLIGTLGDPNLRACILPLYINRALNKADCIQFRPKLDQATPEYTCSLINHPGMLTLAFHLMHGQTRTRVSMGTLRDLLIPVPPILLQQKFANIYRRVNERFDHHSKTSDKNELLFSSLTQRAFRGEL